jgi:hypothetical protein
MTRSTQSPTESADPSTTERLDPPALAERDGVEFAERTYPHEDADHCEAEADGRVVVGVTNADGEALLLVDPERSHAILPNCTVDPGDSWRAVARETASEVANAPVEFRRPVAVRRVEHYTVDCEDDADPDAAEDDLDGLDPHDVTHHVVFDGEVAGGDGPEGDDHPSGSAPAPSVDDDTDWEAGWYRRLPGSVDLDDAGDVLADIRRFLD